MEGTDAPASGPWEVGDVIDDLYEVREVIHTGGMGVVHRVWHRGWHVELAVKTPRSDLLSSAKDIRNFEDEAQAWVGLGMHPHTVFCAYVREFDGTPRVFAEWINGGSLAEAVRSRRLYAGDTAGGLDRLLDVAIQFAWGLDHAYSKRLIHQDVKPANVMLTRDGEVKVTDFGLAKARALTGEKSGCSPGASLLAGFGGMTPAYCSPEQAAAVIDRTVELTHATDVWSWAISVWEMFVGEPPCRFGQSAGAIFKSYRSDNHRPPGIPRMPPQLAELLSRCLIVEPALRAQPIGRLAHELTELYADIIGASYPRPRPEAAEVSADTLSNHALSLVDLGDADRAGQLWRETLAADRHHIPSLYNYGLRRWRAGKITDIELITELEAARRRYRADPVAELLLGRVHMERGDMATARRHLKRAVNSAPSDPEVVRSLHLARSEPEPPEPMVLRGNNSAVGCVSISGDGRSVASGSRDGAVHMWDLTTGSCRILRDRRWRPLHNSRIDAVAVNGDGSRVITLGRGASLRVWNGFGRCLHRFDNVEATTVAISADGRVAVSGGAPGGPVQAWDLVQGRVLRTLRQYGHAVDPGTVALTADGRLAIDYDADEGETRIWEVSSGRLIRSLDRFAGVVVHAGTGSAISPSSVIGKGAPSPARTSVLWRVDAAWATGTVLVPQELLDRPSALGPDGLLVAAGEGTPSGSDVVVWQRGRCLRTFQGHSDTITSVALSSDGRTIVTGSRDHTVRVWHSSPGPSGQFHLAAAGISR